MFNKQIIYQQRLSSVQFRFNRDSRLDMQIIMQFIICFRWKIRGTKCFKLRSELFVALVQTVQRRLQKMSKGN